MEELLNTRWDSLEIEIADKFLNTYSLPSQRQLLINNTISLVVSPHYVYGYSSKHYRDILIEVIKNDDLWFVEAVGHLVRGIHKGHPSSTNNK